MNQTISQFQIRPPRLKDVAAITAMHARSWLDTYPNEPAGVSAEWVQRHCDDMLSQSGLERRKGYIKDYVKAPDKGRFYRIAADKNGSVAGFIVGTKTTEGQELEALYLDKAVIGSGLAQQLFDAYMSWTDRTRPIQTGVVSYNQRAIRFYEKQGFRKIAGSEYRHGGVMPSFRMQREATS